VQADRLLGEAGRIVGLPVPWWDGHLSAATESCLRANWPCVETVAAALLDRGTLTGDEVHALLGDRVAALNLTEVAAQLARLAGMNVDAARLGEVT
jgi:hypothetical protein